MLKYILLVNVITLKYNICLYYALRGLHHVNSNHVICPRIFFDEHKEHWVFNACAKCHEKIFTTIGVITIQT